MIVDMNMFKIKMWSVIIFCFILWLFWIWDRSIFWLLILGGLSFCGFSVDGLVFWEGFFSEFGFNW